MQDGVGAVRWHSKSGANRENRPPKSIFRDFLLAR
jgi:hypothetical protein